MSKKQKINKKFVSEMGQFLQEFDYKYQQKSESQQKEIDKHARITTLRDEIQNEDESTLWKDF